MRISDWSSDVCSSDLRAKAGVGAVAPPPVPPSLRRGKRLLRRLSDVRRGPGCSQCAIDQGTARQLRHRSRRASVPGPHATHPGQRLSAGVLARSEEHTSELQSLMRISYAVFCLKNKQNEPRCKPTTLTNNLRTHTN